VSRTGKAKRVTRKPVSPPSPFKPGVVLGVAAAVIAVLAGGWWMRTRNSPPPAAATAPVPAADFGLLRGRWQRPDGGYVIEIRSVAESGAIEASYFNPSPIHVGSASASLAGGVMRVFIELRDVNYPGSTYRLTYDPSADRLEGTYFQAGLQQTFDVSFSRLTPR